jgi:hypothetical protein
MRIVSEPLLDEFRHAPCCELCGAENKTGMDPHHLRSRGIGGGGRLDVRINIITACRDCHSLIPTSKIGRERILQVVATREKTTPEIITAVMDSLAILPKDATRSDIDHLEISDKTVDRMVRLIIVFAN